MGEHLFRRYLWFVIGLAINSFGVACITKADLGTTQISSVPFVFSLAVPALSFGVTTFIVNMVFVAVQIALLRRDFQPIQFFQIVANILFSALIDVAMAMLSPFTPHTLWARWIWVLVGCAVLAFGICVEVAPGVITVPGEGIVKVIAKVSGVRFGTVKVCFDISQIALGALLSLIVFGRLNGIGWGTVVSALLVGRLVNIMNRRIRFIGALVPQR